MLGSKTIDRIDQMLDAGISGTFRESDYDESKLSRLENKWKRYLADSASSRVNVEREKDNLKSLISDISHQTRTPMTNIRMYAELMAEVNAVSDDSSKALCDALITQVDKLDFLIQSLVRMSRLETEVFAVSAELHPLQPLLAEVCSEMRGKAEQKQIAIVCEDTAESAVFDPRWTREAIGNVIDNAVKYSPAGSQIIVSVKAGELYTEIRISDEGPGIAEAEQAQIFQRFYRGRDHQSEDGIGIGLYLTREILQKQDGFIKVRSEPGKGSVFSINLRRQV